MEALCVDRKNTPNIERESLVGEGRREGGREGGRAEGGGGGGGGGGGEVLEGRKGIDGADSLHAMEDEYLFKGIIHLQIRRIRRSLEI